MIAGRNGRDCPPGADRPYRQSARTYDKVQLYVQIDSIRKTKTMTLRQFEVFLAVARAKSFRRASEVVHLSQPALSQHVRDLEANLGASLFDRLGRSVQLTEAGRILEDH